MNNTYRLVVFDWEGTLGDTLGKVINVLKQESLQMGLGEIDEIDARKYIIMGLVVTLKKCFPSLSAEQFKALIEAVQISLAKRSRDVYLLPGAMDILNIMRDAGIDMAIATNKGYSSLQRDLQEAGLGAYFTTVRCAGQVPAKPCPQMLEEILDTCGVEPKDALMVGDSASDMEMAKALNVTAYGVNFYDTPALTEELIEAGAEQVFEDFQTLAQHLNLNAISSK
jgi:phosphoglycolate phosphatase